MEKDIYTAYAQTARAVEDITGARLVTGPCRKVEAVRARCVVIGILHKQGFTETQIGDVLNRDHSTVHHHKTRLLAGDDPVLQRLYNQTKLRLCL